MGEKMHQPEGGSRGLGIGRRPGDFDPPGCSRCRGQELARARFKVGGSRQEKEEKMTRVKLNNVVFGVVAPLWMLFVALNCSFCVAMQEAHNAGNHNLCPIPYELQWAPSVPASAPAPVHAAPDCSQPYSCIKSYPDPKDEEFLWTECSEKTPWGCDQV